MDLGGSPPGSEAPAGKGKGNRTKVLAVAGAAALVLGYLVLRSRSSSASSAGSSSGTGSAYTYPDMSGTGQVSAVDPNASAYYQQMLQGNAQYNDIAGQLSGIEASLGSLSTTTTPASPQAPAASGGSHVSVGAPWGVAGNRVTQQAPVPVVTTHTTSSWGGPSQ